MQQRQCEVPASTNPQQGSKQERERGGVRARGRGWQKKLPLFKLSIHPLQTCDPENYANPVSVSTTPYTGDGAGVGLAESGDAHPTPATPLSPGASSVCVKPNEPNPDLTDCSQVTQSLCKDRLTESLIEKKIFQCSADAHKLSETKADLVIRF